MSFGDVGSAVYAEALLKEAGFTISKTCHSRPSCFDFAARKSENLVFIKSQPDVDSFNPNDAADLKNVANSVSAIPLVISEKNREKLLEDDTVYSRYGIFAITKKTLESMVFRRAYPLIQAGPGGYYVEIDGATIRQKRQQLGLSAGEMARKIRISRRTLYGYERGMAKASVSAAYNLISTLGIPVAKPVNVFDPQRNRRKCAFLSKLNGMLSKSSFLMGIFRKLEHINVTIVKKAPFDFVIVCPDGKKRIIGGVSIAKEQNLEMRANEILSISNVVKAHPIMITDGQKLSNNDVPCIKKEEQEKKERERIEEAKKRVTEETPDKK